VSLLRDSYRVNIYFVCEPPAARRAKTKLNYGPVSRAGLHGIEGAEPANPAATDHARHDSVQNDQVQH
jgi:hypothetical protein